MSSQHTIDWHLRALNRIRRFFRIAECHYLTNHEWKLYMDSIPAKDEQS